LGDVDGMFELSLLLGRRREAEAAEWERRAADLGHGRACLNAGARLQAAGRDSVEGAALYRRAAEFGVAEAAARLAVMHLRESGLPRDEVEAERWYLRALELGFSGPLPGAQ
jgi:TPR repeat protein